MIGGGIIEESSSSEDQPGLNEQAEYSSSLGDNKEYKVIDISDEEFINKSAADSFF